MDNRSRQNMPTKCGDQAETNGGRRRKTLSKKVKRQSASEFQPQPAATCCMPQRLFPAVSDSAVSGYPLSMEQMLYPTVYHPMYPHPAMMAAIAPAPHLHTNPKYFNNSKQCSYHNAEYTSLPPDNVIQSDQQRRFSDPGLANGVDQSADDDSDHLSNANLVEKVDRLAKDNHRLQSELHDVRLQLQQLQLEMTGWKEAHPGYQPGMVSDLVCELREAMKVHQEAFLARLKQNTHQVNDRLTVKEFDDLKKKLNHVTTEKEDLNDRLKRLEEQMQTVMVHNSLQESNQQELVVLEQEKLKLRRELQEEIDARKAAESQFRSLEQVLGALRKKKVNGIVTLDVDKVEQRGGDGADHVTGVTATSSGESLMSSLGSGSMHSPHVTMSGPVTDL